MDSPQQITRNPDRRIFEFTNEGICEAEKSRFAARCWTLLGLKSDLPTESDWISDKLGNRSVFIQRIDDRVVGFENICPHRFFPVRCAERGNGPIVCPFHGWSYDAAGKLARVPLAEELFGADAHSIDRHLKPIEIGICGNLIFGRLYGNAAAPTLTEYLGPLAMPLEALTVRIVEPLAVFNQEIAANWKHSYELTLDDYHIVTVHPKSFGAQGYLMPGYFRYFRYGSHSAMTAKPRPVDANEFNIWIEDCKNGHANIRAYRIMQIFPNLVVALIPQKGGGATLVVSRYTAEDSTHSRAKNWILATPGNEDTRTETVKLLSAILEEDAIIAEGLQRTSPQAISVPKLGAQEERVGWFDESYAAFMQVEG